ncbi:MAG: glycoside hydrolase family 3 C-terminal domain-containing protein [Lachnospiraceae bacterium]|nr:glycoside hydrolase family 3 C-terminal domain-containing protein [Lachnospiraceae bacterium]
MRKMINRGFSGTTDPMETQREIDNKTVTGLAAEEGFVLLKNEGALPVSKDKKIALYGRGASKTLKGGTGSGDVNERHSVSIYEGLLNAGYTVTTKDWIDSYTKIFDEKRYLWRQDILRRVEAKENDFFNVYAQTPFEIPVGDKATKTDADIAFYVLSRVAGEGADRYLEKGDYYATDEEIEMIKSLCEFYKEVVLVINTGAVVDLSYLDESWASNISAVILYSQPGMEGGNAFARVISGEVTPSGKLTDTWPLKYEDYPGAMDFSHINGDITKEYYTDGIYVGYRYFDSFSVPVRYPFGYGLSYTSFETKFDSMEIKVNKNTAPTADYTNRVDLNEITLNAKFNVKNTGEFAGKEVVEVYLSLPNGELDKEYRRLGGFKKTSLLEKGQQETVEVVISLSNLTSFDEEKSAYILEKGIYGVFVGNGINNAKLVGSVEVEADEVFSIVEHICPVKDELTELVLPDDIKRALYEKVVEDASSLPKVTLKAGQVVTKKPIYTDDLYKAASMENDKILHEAEEFSKNLTIDELILLAMGDPLRQHDGQLGAAGASVPGSAGETNYVAKDKGLAGIPLADGPAGLRLAKKYNVANDEVQYLPFHAALENGYFYDEVEQAGDTYYQYCTAIPVGVCVAQTWNEDIVKALGRTVGSEMEYFGVTLWLAPGMNIHRNPLCGRNFEYYAEDPVLSGKIAAAMTKGVQENAGVGTTIKHFCGNNLEDNRMHNNSIISEKALREIYLRGFEIAVKESQPMSIMTSYNLVNRVHSANNYDICTKVARNEWGFKGLIMTDWTTTHENPESTASGCMRAGNDIVMPGEISDVDNLKAELAAGTLKEEDLRKCMIRLICTIFKSNQYEGAVPYEETIKY